MSRAAAYRDDLALLRHAVRKGGSRALDFFGQQTESWDKSPGNPVSEADLAVNDLLEEHLRGARPDYGWLSEESADDMARLSAQRVWIVDPIDGTRAFLGGRPEFSVSAALVEDGRPVAGVVYNPATDEYYEAAVGSGVRLNGTTVAVSRRTKLEGAEFLVSRSEMKKRNWDETLANCRITPVSSVALKLARVAAGRADATISLWPKRDWDVAAGDLLVIEGGGIVATPDGEKLPYNKRQTRHAGLIAAGPKLLPTLRTRIGVL